MIGKLNSQVFNHHFFIAKATVFNVTVRIAPDSNQSIENAGYSIAQRAISIG